MSSDTASTSGSSAMEMNEKTFDRVQLRIGNADTDEKFEKSLQTLLPPLLIELGKANENIRKKILELLVHINKRLRSRQTVLLPVENLISLYKEHKRSVFVTNFAHIYVLMGYPRLVKDEKMRLLPALLRTLTTEKPVAQKDSFIHLLLPMLGLIQMPDEAAIAQYQLADRLDARQYLLDFLKIVLLVPYTFKRPNKEEENLKAPDGLSQREYLRAIGADTKFTSSCGLHSAEELEKTKVGIVKFFAHRIYPAEEIIVHLIIGHADSRHSVVSLADKEVGHLTQDVDWENEAVLRQILSLYLATNLDEHASVMVSDQVRNKPSSTLRVKLAPYLLKSRRTLVTQLLTPTIKVIEDCLDEGSGKNGSSKNRKLMLAGLDLMVHVALNCENITNEQGMSLLTRLLKFLFKCSHNEDASLKAKGFSVLGQTVCKLPDFILKDINNLMGLFEALSMEKSGEVRAAIYECLTKIAAWIRDNPLSNEFNTTMEALLFENIEKSDGACRQVAIHYADTIYPKDHIPSRYIILQGLGDDEDRVRIEANRAFSYCRQTSVMQDVVFGRVKMPNFIDFVNHDTHHAKKNPFVEVRRLIPVVEFIRLSLLGMSEGLGPNHANLTYEDEDEFRYRISRNVRYYMSSGDQVPAAAKRAVDTYFRLIQVVILTQPWTVYFYKFLEEVLVGNTKDLVKNCKQLFEKIKCTVLMTSRGMVCRLECAIVYSLVCVETQPVETVFKVIKDLITRLNEKDADMQQGSTLCAALLIERLMVKQKGMKGRSKTNLSGCVDDLVKALDSKLTSSMAFAVSNSGNSSSSSSSSSPSVGSATGEGVSTPPVGGSEAGATASIRGASENAGESALQCNLEALTALAQSGCLSHLPPGKPGSDESWPSKAGIMKRIIQIARHTSALSLRCKEAALRCLGALCTGESSFPHTIPLMEALVETRTVKDLHFHAAVGFCFVNVVLGQTSPFKGHWYDRQFPPNIPTKKAGNKEMKWLNSRLYDYLAHSSPVVRQAAAMWTFVLLRRLGVHPDMHLINLQSLLMSLLGDKDDMTQDIACKSLSLLFDQCPTDQRQSLVSELINVIMNGNKGKSSESTASLFSDSSAEGGMITYKEMCALATDLNQPDLVYKFLAVANQQSEWNSRRGGALGIAALARKVGVSLEPHMGKLVPRLFRYQYDPHPKIQQVMAQLWGTVSSSSTSSRVLQTHFTAVLDELKVSLTSRNPRVREAAIWALKDALRVVSKSSPPEIFDHFTNSLKDLWTAIFNLMDDTKDVIRQAAEAGAFNLAKVCTRLSEDLANSDSPTARDALRKVVSGTVPVLLEKGFMSRVPEVNSLTVHTLLQLVRDARDVVKPVLPQLVAALLEALNLEPQALGILSQQLASQPELRHKLDAKRVAQAKSTPVADILRMCIDYIDENTLEALIVPLAETIRDGVGLGTKCGTANFLVTLSVKCGNMLAPHTGKLLAALLYGVIDRNRVVQREMANAIGHLARFAKPSSVQKLLIRVKAWYFEKEENVQHHLACCYVFHATAHHSRDTLIAQGAVAFPLIYLAKQHDESVTRSAQNGEDELEEEKRKLWGDTWLEVVSSAENILKKHFDAILAVISEAFRSPMWNIRKQAALAIFNYNSTVHLDDVASNEKLFNIVLTQIKETGSWSGKVYLLKALRYLSEHCGITVMQLDLKTQVCECLLHEIKRGKTKNYRSNALLTLGRACEAHRLNYFEQGWAVIKTITKEDMDDEKEDVELVWNIADALSYLWPFDNAEIQETYIADVIAFIVQLIREGTWRTQLATLQALNKIIFKCVSGVLDKDDAQKNMDAAFEQMRRCFENSKYQSLKEEVLRILETLAKMEPFPEKLKPAVMNLLKMYADESVPPNLKERAATVMEKLK